MPYLPHFPGDRTKQNGFMTIYIIVALAFLTHIGFAGSRLAVPLFAVDLNPSPFIVGTIVSLYAAFPVARARHAVRERVIARSRIHVAEACDADARRRHRRHHRPRTQFQLSK